MLNNKGFSLLEMMVAIVIMAISFAALYQAVGGASRIIRIDERYSYAHGLAQSLLANYAIVPDRGLDESGEADGGFRWHVKAQAIDGDNPTQLALGALQKIEISVSWGEQGKERNITLHSIVAGQSEDDYAP